MEEGRSERAGSLVDGRYLRGAPHSTHRSPCGPVVGPHLAHQAPDATHSEQHMVLIRALSRNQTRVPRALRRNKPKKIM